MQLHIRQDASPHRDTTQQLNCNQNELLSSDSTTFPYHLSGDELKEDHEESHNNHSSYTRAVSQTHVSEELYMEELSYRSRCISEDTEVFNIECYLLQSPQTHEPNHNRCSSIDWSLSNPFATHVRKVSHDPPEAPPPRALSDTSLCVDEDEESCIPFSEFDFGATVGLVKSSSLNNKRRRRSSGQMETREDCCLSIAPSSEQISKKRRTFRNRALVAEDFDQILTKIF
jgi:hypothetical protein